MTAITRDLDEACMHAVAALLQVGNNFVVILRQKSNHYRILCIYVHAAFSSQIHSLSSEHLIDEGWNYQLRLDMAYPRVENVIYCLILNVIKFCRLFLFRDFI